MEVVLILNRVGCSSSVAAPFFACWSISLKRPKWQNSGHNFKFSRAVSVFLCSLAEASSPTLHLYPLVPRFRALNPAEPKDTGIGSTHSESGSLGVMMRSANPLSTPWFSDPCILVTLYHILAICSLYVHSPGGQHPNLQNVVLKLAF